MLLELMPGARMIIMLTPSFVEHNPAQMPSQ